MRHLEGVILYLVVVYWATMNYAIHVLASNVASIVIDIWGCTTTLMLKKRCQACVRKLTQFGSGVEKSIYKSLGDTVEDHIVTGGDDQVNVEDFFENSEDEIKSILDDALKMHV